MPAVTYGAEDLICGADSRPLRLFHGTCRDFDRFTVEVLRSAGAHFGCAVQANHFAVDQPGARIFPVYLCSKRIADVRPNDFGWRYPNGTLFGLQFTRILSAADSIALVGASRDSFIEAFHADMAIAADTEKCKAINRQIEGMLETRGFDCILYSNRQEPPDGIPRDAYLVLSPSQIMSALSGKTLG